SAPASGATHMVAQAPVGWPVRGLSQGTHSSPPAHVLRLAKTRNAAPTKQAGAHTERPAGVAGHAAGTKAPPRRSMASGMQLPDMPVPSSGHAGKFGLDPTTDDGTQWACPQIASQAGAPG